ncbi:serine hydroxymethyltransferase [candidate division KSB1 bacterium]
MRELLKDSDPMIYNAIVKEIGRQNNKLEMIASENFVSRAVLEAAGCVMTNKYAEGYPGKRYYGGCEFVDIGESLARERAVQLFKCGFANVQPHSGAQANMAAFFSLAKPGSRLLGMDLSHGGHLTHGSPVNFSGKLYEVASYGVRKDDGVVDYDEVQNIAERIKPQIIIAGFSAYPRKLDFKRFGEIAESVGAFLVSDIAHVAGLVATGLYPDAIPYSDIVTTTTHKTLRGPRGGLILLSKKAAEKEYTDPWTGKQRLLKRIVDSRVFPGTQGGPLMHIIAAKAVAFGEDLKPEYKTYCEQVIANAKTLADTLITFNYNLVSGGTDNHLLLVDLSNKNITGAQAEKSLEKAGITVNKNMVPFDTQSPMVTSGIRIGTPAITTRGFKEEEIKIIGEYINHVLSHIDDDSVLREVSEKIENLCNKFPMYDFF